MVGGLYCLDVLLVVILDVFFLDILFPFSRFVDSGKKAVTGFICDMNFSIFDL